MRILYVNDFYEYGGTEVIMQELANLMRSRGHETYFATASDSQTEAHHRIDRIKSRIPYMLRRTVFFNVDPLATRSMKRIIQKVKPDILHCHNLEYVSLAPVKLALSLKLPCAVTFHDHWPICLKRSMVKSEKALCEKRNWDDCASVCRYKKYDRLIRPFVIQGMEERRRILSSPEIRLVCVSNYLKEIIIGFGYPPENITVIHNGVNSGFFRPGSEQPERMVLFVGRFIKPKGLGDFVTTAKEVKRRLKEVEFVAIGGKMEQDETPVTKIGWLPRSDLIAYYQKATCLCIPSSLPEPLPTVALEAMACGKPIVAYSVGGIPEIVDNGKDGFLVQPGDVQALSERVAYLLENKEIAQTMGESARRKLIRSFSLKTMADCYERLYSSIT